MFITAKIAVIVISQSTGHLNASHVITVIVLNVPSQVGVFISLVLVL